MARKEIYNGDIITGNVECTCGKALFNINIESNNGICIEADKEIVSVAMYNASGTLLSKNSCNRDKEITLPLPTNNNIYIIKTEFIDGSSNITKYQIKAQNR